MTDDFMPLENGGFLITQIGLVHRHGAGSRCRESRRPPSFRCEPLWHLLAVPGGLPLSPPLDGFKSLTASPRVRI